LSDKRISREARSEWRQIAEWDWTWLDDGEDEVIHAVQTLDNEATADDDWHGIGKTECGKSGELWIPGLFDRMSAWRCSACCKATGMPPGRQSPKNDDRCRPVVERRMDFLGIAA
jgi:hypothetical protein